ncbi:MAG: hypothetical protein LBR42_03980, partial [Candidatus Methanoplasma sp.]|nr:hypothetical protein [Candidatus Methanoplasma sp.]
TVFGVKDPHGLQKIISDTIMNKLGIMPSVTLVPCNDKTCIKITVRKGNHLVSLDGRFYSRVGNTTHAIDGEELQSLILSRKELSWTDLPIDSLGMGKFSQDAIKFFVAKGLESGRMSQEAAKCDNDTLLKNYQLMNDEGLLRSGALLFMDRPSFISYGASVKIGAFTDEERLLRHDLIEGPVIMQPDRIMDLIMNKYVLGTDEVDFLARVTKYPYPMRALREAVLNSIIHRDYSSIVETTIRVYTNSVEIWNPGHLPKGWTKEDILTKHISKPANPQIAKVFLDMGYIERFGSGIEMMSSECKAMGLPLPEYIVDREMIKVVFRLPVKKEKNTSGKMLVDESNLSENEIKVCKLIHEDSGITIVDMSTQLKLSRRQIEVILISLRGKGIIDRIGSRKSGNWVFIGTKR